MNTTFYETIKALFIGVLYFSILQYSTPRYLMPCHKPFVHYHNSHIHVNKRPHKTAWLNVIMDYDAVSFRQSVCQKKIVFKFRSTTILWVREKLGKAQLRRKGMQVGVFLFSMLTPSCLYSLTVVVHWKIPHAVDGHGSLFIHPPLPKKSVIFNVFINK